MIFLFFLFFNVDHVFSTEINRQIRCIMCGLQHCIPTIIKINIKGNKNNNTNIFNEKSSYKIVRRPVSLNN